MSWEKLIVWLMGVNSVNIKTKLGTRPVSAYTEHSETAVGSLRMRGSLKVITCDTQPFLGTQFETTDLISELHECQH